MRRGFTLLELMVASVLCAVLMGGVLAVLAGVARDRKRFNATGTAGDSRLITGMVQRDLIAADSVTSSANGRELILIGHGGIDRQTLTPTHRLARVTYRVVGRDGNARLVRQQQALDDVAHPDDWQALAAAGVTALHVATPVANRAIVTLERGSTVEWKELVLR